MRSDRRIFPAILAILILLSVAFFVLQQDADNDELSGDVSDPLIGENTVAAKAKIPGGASNPSDLKSKFQDATKDRAFAQDTALNFGAQIQSGDCIATFRILDKKDEPLIEAQLRGVQLWRKLGDYWVEEHAELDKKNSQVVCAGSFGTGLEPGEYELGVDARAYGAIWHRFKIAVGQNITGQIKLPHWRRVIKLRYVDERGKLLKKILNKPIYNAPRTSLPKRERKTPIHVLASPPTYTDGTEGVNDAFGGGSAGQGGRGRRGRRYVTHEVTDEGFWYVEVFAGGQGILSQNFSMRRDGRSAIYHTGNFEESSWDDYEVKINYDDVQKARLERYKPANADDPGDLHVIAGKPDEEPLPTAWTPGYRYPRAIFAINSSVKVQPFVHGRSYQTERLGETRIADRKALKSRGVWYTDVFNKNGRELIYSYNDGALFRSGVFTHEFRSERIGDNPYLVNMNDTVAGNRTTIETTMPTRTSKAWARGLKVGWVLPRDERHTLRVNQALGNRFSVRTALAFSADEENESKRDLTLTFMGEGRKREADFSFRLEETQQQSLEDGSLTLKPETKGIILRAVDVDGAGLPWVEASLVPLNRLHAAFAIQKRMNSWRDAKRTDRHFTNKHVEVEIPGSTMKLREVPEIEFEAEVEEEVLDEVEKITKLVDGFTDKDLREILKKGLYEEFETDEERRFFAKNYAWYNTHRRLRSDRRGYLIDWKQGIVPGDRYAVFLWSKSRDHLASDKMILFTAKEGLTDLGAVLLPDYK
ncbi:MAG: hypothetical protein ACI97A_002728 [Planctomycetota bacterium]|jgi:hypothetical protein